MLPERKIPAHQCFALCYWMQRESMSFQDGAAQLKHAAFVVYGRTQFESLATNRHIIRRSRQTSHLMYNN